MTSPSRRRFLSGSVLTIASLTGYVEVPTEPEEPPTEPGETSSDLGGAIDALPPADAVDRSYRTVVVETVDVDDADELTATARATVQALDVEPTDISSVASVFTSNYRRRLGTARGSFDALVGDDAAASVDDWQVEDDGELAFASTDGHAAFAGGNEASDRIDTATTMAEAAVGDRTQFRDDDDVETAFEALEEMAVVLFVPEPGDGPISTAASGELRSLAGGFETHPADLSGTSENEYYLFPSPDAALDEETVRAIVAGVEPGKVVETTTSRVDGAVHVEVVVEAPPDYDREAAPDARVATHFDREETTMTFEHVRGEPIPTDELELWVNGELAATQPADDGDVFEEGDAVTVDIGALAVVGLRWFDESANAYYTYASETVDRSAFEGTYDIDAGTATVRYVGTNDADPSKLSVTHRHDDGVRTVEDAFADVDGTLTAGDEVVVDDVEFGDSVRVELAVPDVTGVHGRSLANVRVSPPRMHLYSHPEHGTMLRYHDETERDADEFRLLVDGEPADTQLAAETETLSPGDSLRLGEFPLGSELAVEWVAPDEPTVVAEAVVVPRTHVATTYDADDGTVTFEHRDGQTLPADDVELRVNGEATDAQPADELDEFGPGSEFTADAAPFASVELVWVGEDQEHRLGGTTTGRDAIEATYDPDAEELELVYVGDHPADPERLRVQRHGPHSSRDDEPTAFAAEHDELTSGDGITVDASIGERVAVVIHIETENTASAHSIAHYSTKPRRPFAFREDEGALTAVYQDAVVRAADEFRVLVDGEPADRQPGDVHDVLGRETTLDLGDVPVGSTVTVEWTPPEDAIEVGEHVVAPSATFDVSYDADEGTIEVVHAGGDALDADDIRVVAPPAIERPTDWNGEGEVVAGDASTYEVAEPPRMVYVSFKRQELLHRERIDSDDGSDDEDESEGNEGSSGGSASGSGSASGAESASGSGSASGGKSAPDVDAA